MGEDYYCSRCSLMFVTGWDHYHAFADYAAGTNLVCTACGNQHLVEHAIGGLKPDRLCGTQKPRRWPAHRRERPDSWLLPPAEWVEVEPPRPVRPSRREVRYAKLEGIQDPLDLSAVPCVHCGEVGRLRDQWPEGETRCPCCGAKDLKRMGVWIT